MERVRLKRDANLGPGTWTTDNQGKAIVACGGCGKCAGLQHVIEPSGEVNPSLECPHGCGWHVFVILEGWRPPP